MQPIDILLVEDNEGDILLTTEALQDQKIVNKIFTVRDGMEALDYLFKKKQYKNCSTPHVVLLDINLPKLNGHEVLKEIRSNKHLEHLPVFMLSTSSSFEDFNASIKNKADFYMTKPIVIDDFIRNISSIKELKISLKHI